MRSCVQKKTHESTRVAQRLELPLAERRSTIPIYHNLDFNNNYFYKSETKLMQSLDIFQHCKYFIYLVFKFPIRLKFDTCQMN